MKGWAKISSTAGSFAAVIDNTDNLGSSVAAPGDVDGDGIDDLAIGAPGDDDGGTDRGAAYVVLLTASSTVKGYAKLSDLSGGFNAVIDNSDAVGRSVGPLGDLDRDGVGDVPFRPVRLFALVVEQHGSALMLLRSPVVGILDAAERMLPVLTPDVLVDAHPLMRSPR